MTVEPFPSSRRASVEHDAATRAEALSVARRVVAAFPTSGPEAGASALGAMVRRLEPGSLFELRLRLDPDRAHLMGAVRLRAPGEQGLVERRLVQIVTAGFPRARFASGRLRVAHLPAVAAVTPRAMLLENMSSRTCAAKVQVGERPDGAGARAVSPGRRRLDIEAALRALLPMGTVELRLGLAPWIADRHAQEALARLRRDTSALALAGGEHGDDMAGVSRLARELGTAEGVTIAAHVASQQVPDAATLDLLCLALFGQPADTAPHPIGPGLDIRRVWSTAEALPELLPTRVAVRRLADARPPAPRLAARPGDLVLGEGPAGEPVTLVERDRARHLYVIGATGTGKSTLMVNLMAQDMLGGQGVILLDPHGDLADEAAELASRSRRRDLLVADAADPEGGFCLDILAGQGGEPAIERNYVANALTHAFTSVLWAGVPEAFGPMFELYFRNALFLLMASRGDEASLLDFERIFHDAKFRERLLERCDDPKVVEFWRRVAPAVTNDEISLPNVAPYIVCKLTQITGNPVMRRILGGGSRAIRFGAAMDAGRVVVLKAPKGLLGVKDTRFLCAMTLLSITQAAMARAARPATQRRPVRLYIDEFQNCAGDALGDLLAESRKYGVSLTLANQSLGQVDGDGHRPDTGAAALANAANLLAFRVGAPDAARLAPWFAPDVDWAELCRQRDFHATARILADGAPAPAFTLRASAPPRLS